jgi:hypothetical protein
MPARRTALGAATLVVPGGETRDANLDLALRNNSRSALIEASNQQPIGETLRVVSTRARRAWRRRRRSAAPGAAPARRPRRAADDEEAAHRHRADAFRALAARIDGIPTPCRACAAEPSNRLRVPPLVDATANRGPCMLGPILRGPA